LTNRARRLSSPTNWGAHELNALFRGHTAAAEEDGTYKLLYLGRDNYRIEFRTPTFQMTRVVRKEGGYTVRSLPVSPTVEEYVWKSLPIVPIGFDSKDLVRAIVDRPLGGRKVRCVEFDTIDGLKKESNEVCVDAETGTFAYIRADIRAYTYSDFFRFGDALFPRHILIEEGDIRIEIDQMVKPIEGPLDPSLMEPPPGATFYPFCTEFRLAVARDRLQPKAGPGTNIEEIQVRGEVLPDGKMRNAVVDTASRAELRAEALDLVSRWTFQPATCDGKPINSWTTISIQFQGR